MTADDPWPALLALAAALLVWSPRGALAVRRVRVPDARVRARTRAADDPVATARRRWLLTGAAGLAAGLLVGGAVGVGIALAITVGGERLLRHATPDPQHAARSALIRNLPGACDLMAVCLAAGVPVGGALAAVGEAVPAPLARHLQGVAALYRLGADPRRAWADVPAELAALGRVLVRTGESGSAAAPALRTLAAESRSAGRAATEAAARRAGVWVLAPLGLCFLPAFLCLGVVPLVLGIAGDVFG